MPAPSFRHKHLNRQTPAPRKPSVFESREVSLFKNGANQALRIPKEFELPGDRAMLRKEGDSLILSPVKQPSLAQLLDSWQPLGPGDDFPEIADLPSRPIDL